MTLTLISARLSTWLSVIRLAYNDWVAEAGMTAEKWAAREPEGGRESERWEEVTMLF